MTEHYQGICPFCREQSTKYHVENGVKIVDKLCDCKRAVEYFAKKAKPKKEVAAK